MTDCRKLGGSRAPATLTEGMANEGLHHAGTTSGCNKQEIPVSNRFAIGCAHGGCHLPMRLTAAVGGFLLPSLVRGIAAGEGCV